MRASFVRDGVSTGFATGKPSLSELEKSLAGAEQTNSISINVSGVPSRGTASAVRAGLRGVFAFPNTSRQASSHPAKSALPVASGTTYARTKATSFRSEEHTPELH